MKKFKYIITAFVLVVLLSCTAYAVTPTLKPPVLPKVPEISVNVPEIKFPDGYFDDIINQINHDSKGDLSKIEEDDGSYGVMGSWFKDFKINKKISFNTNKG